MKKELFLQQNLLTNEIASIQKSILLWVVQKSLIYLQWTYMYN